VAAARRAFARRQALRGSAQRLSPEQSWRSRPIDILHRAFVCVLQIAFDPRLSRVTTSLWDQGLMYVQDSSAFCDFGEMLSYAQLQASAHAAQHMGWLQLESILAVLRDGEEDLHGQTAALMLPVACPRP
jgi:hypothetical protein